MVDGVSRTFVQNAQSQLVPETDGTQTVTHAYYDWGNLITRTVTGSGATTESYGCNFHNLTSTRAKSAAGPSGGTSIRG